MDVKSILYAVVVIAVLLFTGCVSPPPEKPMLFVEKANGNVESENINCEITVLGVKDQRVNTSGFGTLPSFDIYAESVPDWVGRALEMLDPMVFSKRESVKLNLNVEIYKAYVHNQVTSKSANVVLKVHYLNNHHLIKSQIYRGQDTQINWSSSAEEVERGMNDAMSDVLQKMRIDINELCVR
jgi:hypothetical protein